MDDYIKQLQNNRSFMKSSFAEDLFESDQEKKVAQPPLTKAAKGDRIVSLTREFAAVVKEANYLTLLQERKSQRIYKDESLTLEQLSFLLWSTQGVKAIRGNNYATIRPVPSGGARHAFETYLAVFKVEGLVNGIYHYLPLEHAIEFVMSVEDLENKVSDSLCEQQWAGKAAAVFFYSAVPYRSEWRYGIEAHKLMLLDAGHVVQNLYLSCQAIGAGTCAIAAFDQMKADDLLELDGENEYVIYAAPVGLI